ncbi:MAG: transcription antitermination factor NusB [Anaerococcus sp.]|nr:antitermination protein NusB [Anaerococcus sp.]MDD7044659.1 transcription antitermination factor NusB [Peptoniphilaceae bacterium]MDY2918098.1 transcription antitermination factor NusB [Anaerococcus sp.]
MRRTEQRERIFRLIYEDSISKIEEVDRSLEDKDLLGEDFIQDSLNSYLDHKSMIDIKIDENLDNKHKNLSKVVRAIICLSINEIYFMDIPTSVSINEAVNLAKKYSNQDDYRLVNSILGTITRKDNK